MEPSDRRPPAAAPSLVSGGAVQSASSTYGSTHEPTRILASLEGRVGAASAQSRRRGKVVGIAAVTLIVAAALIAGLWAVEHARTRPYSETDLASVVPHSEPLHASTRSGMPDMHAAEAEAAPAVATIVNLPPLESQAAPAPAPPHAQTAPSSASSPQSGVVPPSAATQSSARPNADAVHRNAVAANHAPTHVASAVRKNNEAARPVLSPRDADVDLLAALVAHLNPQPPDPVAARKGVTDAPGSAASAALPGASKAVALTTQEQIAQCNALGFFEAQLCRLRVCSGRFGKDSACSLEDVQPAVSK